MKTTTKYILIGLAIVAGVALLWWLFGGLLAGLFGAGGGGVLQQYITKELAGKREQAQIQASTDQALAEHDQQANQQIQRANQQFQQQLSAIDQRAHQQFQQANQSTDQAIDNARSVGEVDRIEGASLREHESYLKQFQARPHPLIKEPGDKERGSVGRPVLMLLALLSAVALFLLAPHVGAVGETLEAHKARAKRIQRLLNGYQSQLKACQQKLTTTQKAATKACETKIKHAQVREQIVCRGQVQKCQASLRVCNDQKLLLSRPPSPWGYCAACGGVTAAICAGVITIREVTRP